MLRRKPKLRVSGAERPHSGGGRMIRLRLAAAAGSLALAAVIAGTPVRAAEITDLVSRDALRVCADPFNMPMSNQAGEGFENKIAELVARTLELPLEYTWFPDVTGWYRNTLGGRFCDVAFNVVSGADPVQNTNPYYRSAWVLFYRSDDADLAGVESLSDPRLKGKRLGVIANSPVGNHMIRIGLMEGARSYPLMVDRRYASPAEDMIRDVVSGEIDAGSLWGPVAGHYIDKSGADLTMVPLVKEKAPPLAYRMTFGVRPGEVEWRHQLNDFIRDHQDELLAILRQYKVPLLDDQGNLMTGSE